MRGERLGTVVALLVVGAWVPSVWATDATLRIVGSGGVWNAYVQLSNDCRGLSSFIIDVTASGGLTITSSVNRAPASDNDIADLFGFYKFRSDGTNGAGIMAGQETIYGTSNDPNKDARVLQMVGILPGSRLDPLSGHTIAWGAPVLLASGTYGGTEGTLHVDNGYGYLNCLRTLGGAWYGPGNVDDTNVTAGQHYVPEPVTLALLVVGGFGLFRRRVA